MSLDETEEREIMLKWRKANPNIVHFWSVLERAAVKAIQSGQTTAIHRGIEVSYRWGSLLIKLPSGRTICYPRATVSTEQMQYGEKQTIEYEGLNQTTKKWERVPHLWR